MTEMLIYAGIIIVLIMIFLVLKAVIRLFREPETSRTYSRPQAVSKEKEKKPDITEKIEPKQPQPGFPLPEEAMVTKPETAPELKEVQAYPAPEIEPDAEIGKPAGPEEVMNSTFAVKPEEKISEPEPEVFKLPENLFEDNQVTSVKPEELFIKPEIQLNEENEETATFGQEVKEPAPETPARPSPAEEPVSTEVIEKQDMASGHPEPEQRSTAWQREKTVPEKAEEEVLLHDTDKSALSVTEKEDVSDRQARSIPVESGHDKVSLFYEDGTEVTIDGDSPYFKEFKKLADEMLKKTEEV